MALHESSRLPERRRQQQCSFLVAWFPRMAHVDTNPTTSTPHLARFPPSTLPTPLHRTPSPPPCPPRCMHPQDSMQPSVIEMLVVPASLAPLSPTLAAPELDHRFAMGRCPTWSCSLPSRAPTDFSAHDLLSDGAGSQRVMALCARGRRLFHILSSLPGLITRNTNLGSFHGIQTARSRAGGRTIACIRAGVQTVVFSLRSRTNHYVNRTTLFPPKVQSFD